MAAEKPPEELYDVIADPHEINNLADSPRHQAILKQMRVALDKWRRETKDLGDVPEMELRERMRPGGVWQKVAAPAVSESAAGSDVKVKLATATEGAPIAYTTDDGEKPRWLLYTGALTLKRPATLRVKACRLGYLDSDEIVKKYDSAGNYRNFEEDKRDENYHQISGTAGAACAAGVTDPAGAFGFAHCRTAAHGAQTAQHSLYYVG
jgi:hypothetical protein